MKVTVTRRGGLAGIALRGSADTDQFAGVDETLRAHVGSSAEPAHPDGFVYDLELDGQTLSLNESEITPELQRLIDAAMAKGEIV